MNKLHSIYKKTILTLLSATITITLGSLAYADDCSIEIHADATIKYNIEEFTVDSNKCKTFTILVEHTEIDHAEGMHFPEVAYEEHNLNISEPQYVTNIIVEGAKAGYEKGFINENSMGLMYHSKLLGDEEKDSIVIDTAKFEKGKEYTYFCSTPGHLTMRGTLIVN